MFCLRVKRSLAQAAKWDVVTAIHYPGANALLYAGDVIYLREDSAFGRVQVPEPVVRHLRVAQFTQPG